jgi:AhpD family alkylhydroperoxidase
VDRVELIAPEAAPAELDAIYRRADAALQGGDLPGPTLFGNQVRALAHHPQLLKALIGVYEAFAAASTVERKLMELGILIVSRVNACDYCLRHHTPLGKAAGLSAEQLDCIERGGWQERRDLWAERDWLVICYAERMTREPYKIDDEFFADLQRHFDDRQIVELTMRFALCSAWNKFNDALGLDTESAFRHACAEIMGR